MREREGWGRVSEGGGSFRSVPSSPTELDYARQRRCSCRCVTSSSHVTPSRVRFSSNDVFLFRCRSSIHSLFAVNATEKNIVISPSFFIFCRHFYRVSLCVYAMAVLKCPVCHTVRLRWSGLTYHQFLPRDGMHKRVLCRRAVSVCLDVWVYVAFVYCVETAEDAAIVAVECE